jgi:CRP-like cAMP-binding protein
VRSYRRVNTDHISGVSLFSGCSPDELQEIARLCMEVQVAPGTVLCREGQPGDQCFIISDGEVSVSVGGREIAVLGPGSFFGEAAIMDHGLRMATVEALTPLRLLAFTPSEFLTLLHQLPRVSCRVLVGVENRLRLVSRSLFSHVLI